MKTLIEKINNIKAQIETLNKERESLTELEDFNAEAGTSFDTKGVELESLKSNLSRFESVLSKQEETVSNEFTQSFQPSDQKAKNKEYHVGIALGQWLYGKHEGLYAEVAQEYGNTYDSFEIPKFVMGSGLTTSTDSTLMGNVVDNQVTIMQSNGDDFLKKLGVQYKILPKGKNSMYLPKIVQTVVGSSDEAATTDASVFFPSTTQVIPARADSYSLYTTQYELGDEANTISALIQDSIHGIGRQKVARVYAAIVAGTDASVAVVGGTLDVEDAIDLTKIKYDLNLNTTSFVTSTNVRAYYENTARVGSGNGLAAWTDAQRLVGRPAVEGNSLLEGINIYGDWSKVIIVERPTVQVIRDTTTYVSEDQVRLITRGYASAGMRTGLSHIWTYDGSLA